MKILYTSDEIRNKVIELFSDTKKRRIAIVAFVGESAEAFLPNPKGMKIICWLKAGGTSADALRRLQKRGARIYSADSLHMKLYWAEEKGAVITSANLSSNALGSGNLRELGVYLSDAEVNVERIVKDINPKPVTSKKLKQLDKEGREIDLAINRSKSNRIKEYAVLFDEWYELPSRREWKFGWWDSTGSTAKIAKQVAKKEYGVANPYDCLNCRNKTDYAKGSWMLSFSLEKDKPSQTKWISVDYVVKINRSDIKAYSRSYPYQAIQVWRPSYYPLPPFRIDGKFRKALELAIVEYGVHKLQDLKTTILPAKILKRIYGLYKK